MKFNQGSEKKRKELNLKFIKKTKKMKYKEKVKFEKNISLVN